jgi:hypothetical protein
MKIIICKCKKHKKKKRLTLIKRIQLYKLKEGISTMTEIQQDQYGIIEYTFVDDSGLPIDVESVELVSSNPEFLETSPETRMEPGKYPFRLTWVGLGVGILDLKAIPLAGREPITDQEAFSTIPNIAEGVSKTVVVKEL